MKPNTNERFKGKKILFACIPAEGRLNPLTGLAKSLQAAGAELAWYTSTLFASKLEKLGITHYPFVKAMDVNSANVNEQFPERQKIEDTIKRINFDIINGVANRAPEFYEDIKVIHESFAFDLLICDCSFPVIPFVKHLLGIPVVCIGVTPLAEDSVDLPPYGMALLPAQTAAERKQHEEMRNAASQVTFKESIDAFDEILKAYGIDLPPSMILNLLIKSSDLYFQIGTPGLEYKRSDLGENIRFIGTLLPYSEPVAQEEWFDERVNQYEHVVLVTQGTVEKNVHKLLAPTLEAFKDSNVLVIATTGNSGTADLKMKYPQDNFIIADYLPYDAVMAYTDVFISNGGYGGVLLGVKNHLPLVVAGLHEGKNEICARVGYFNYGINLKTETPAPENIREAVTTILGNTEYKENVQRLAAELKTYDSIALCFRYIEELLSK